MTNGQQPVTGQVRSGTVSLAEKNIKELIQILNQEYAAIVNLQSQLGRHQQNIYALNGELELRFAKPESKEKNAGTEQEPDS